MDERRLRRLAQEVRRDLPDLIPDGRERARVDADLGSALDQPPGSAEDALRQALWSHEAIRTRLAADTDRAITPAGDVTAPIGVLFICPNKDYTVVREVVTGEALLCPRDGAMLERYQG